MIPKTQIIYSYIYNRVFDENFSRADIKKLKKDSENFMNLYNKYLGEILNLIEKHHLKQWEHNFIPIYIVSNARTSFSEPLTITLKYSNNGKYLLVVLAHELLHNNMGKKKFKDSKQLHIYMEPILDKIILDMSINLKKELDIFNKIIRRMYRKND